jgi:hypothetical protein
MESNVSTRPALDVGPRSTRPAIALLLAVLSVPGSTVAWDLPAGGLWIGLPLGVAAIVIGLRARREGVSGAQSAITIVALVLAGLAIAQMVVYSAVVIAT